MNMCKCGCGILVEHNYKRGHARKGVPMAKEHKIKIGLANKGRPMPEHQKRMLIAIHTGRKQSDEERKKRSKIAKKRGFGKWMKGRTLSKEIVQKIINTRKSNNIKCSEETKKKISIANSGKNNGMYGVKHSDEYKKMHSEIMKNLYKNNPIILENLRTRWKTEKHRDDCRIAALKAAESLKKMWYHNTKPEIQMKKILEDLNIPFIHSYPVYDIKHGYMADFFIPDKKMIIEVDGKYWHDYPYGTEKDKIRKIELTEKGYNVLHFWEYEFSKEDIQRCLNNGL